VRLAVLAAALLISVPLCAQEKEGTKKKKAAAVPKAAHQQASKEQIRKFNEMQKKQKDTK
jgi:hypothetical protein